MSAERETRAYEVGPEDHDALTRFLAGARGPAKPSRAGSIGCIVFAVALACASPFIPEAVWSVLRGNVVWLLLGAAPPTLLFVLAVIEGRRVNRRALLDMFTAPHNRWVAGPWQARIGPEGLTMVSAYVTQSIGWEIIWRIGEDDHRAYFALTSRTGHVVPRSAFERDEDFRWFVELARRLRDDADRVPRATAALPTSEGISPDRG